jgi:ABC-2 type transport system ATP-binding protein
MIHARNLTREFGPKVAVDDISFTLQWGEVLGFLGPNGAGKSTTMRMITGYLAPTSGTVVVGEHDIIREPVAARRLMGYLPENAPSYSDMTVRGFLGFAAGMRGLSGAKARQAIARVTEMCFLQPVLQQGIDTLSKGYRHRICFAQSIIHDPDILILDEPTDGLDPNQKREVRGLIKAMGKNKAIIFSTHILEEVEAVCSRAVIIDRGRIVANGTPEELKKNSPDADTVTVTIGGASDRAERDLAVLPGVESVTGLPGERPVFRLRPADGEPPPSLVHRVLGAAAGKPWTIDDIRVEEGRLEDVFRLKTMQQPPQKGKNG